MTVGTMQIKCPLCGKLMYNNKAIYNMSTKRTDYEFTCYDCDAKLTFWKRRKGIDEY